MTSFPTPPQTVPALTIAGQLVAQFDPVPYSRTINNVVCRCTSVSTVAICIGSTSDAAVRSSIVGNTVCTYSPAKAQEIPPGWPLYVVWSDADPNTDTASATLTAFGEY